MKYRGIWPLMLFVVLVGIAVLLSNSSLGQNKVVQPPSTKSQTPILKVTAKVLRVVDGDTIEVELNNKKETVRLIGIDAPESVDPEKTTQCFGKEASVKAKEILDGKIITLESDPTQENRDKYGRLLRYVFLDSLNFNKFMISEGYAYEYTHLNNSYKYMDEFKNVQKQAREKKKGFWADDTCNSTN